MVQRFQFIREADDGGLEDVIQVVREMSGQSNIEEKTTVLRSEINVPDLTGDNTEDIKNIHNVIKKITETIKGE